MNNIKWKDAGPSDTISLIRDLLGGFGITCTEQMGEPLIPGCYSSRIMADGLEDYIATNGKGTTPEYCLASGYAEFMERAQNRLFLNEILEDDRHQMIKAVPNHEAQYRFATEKELLDNPDSFVNFILQQTAATMEHTPPGISRELLVMMKLREAYPHLPDNHVLMQPFYNVGKATYEWQPCDLLKIFYMSNGMSAGNTLEEAMVQGFSEIFERYSQIKIMTEHITPPDIPEYVISRYPYIAKTITNIEASGPYKVILKDCSLGKEQLPVVCGIILNTETLTFGVRFGSHPDMGIALERVFTESLQGKNLEEFTRYNSIVFDEGREQEYHNLFNTAKVGCGYYPAALFASDFDYEYRPWSWQKGTDNQELAHNITKKLLQMGKEVWIHDASFMGFPSVWIIIPGMSELLPYSLTYLNGCALRVRATQVFHHLGTATEEELSTLISYCHTFRNAVLENTIRVLYRIPLAMEFHGGNQLDFLESVIHYHRNDVSQAISCIRRSRSSAPDSREHAYLTGAIFYMEGRQKAISEKELLHMLTSLCGEELAMQICRDFGSPDIILKRLYPSCVYPDCADCQNPACRYTGIKDFYRILFQGYAASSSATGHLHHFFNAI